MNDFENRDPWEEEAVQPVPEENTDTEEVFDAEAQVAEETPQEHNAGIFVTHNVTKKRKRVWPLVVLLSLLAGVIFGIAFGFANNIVSNYIASRVNIETTNVTFKKGTSDVAGTNDIAVIAEECMPSIVAITNRGEVDVMTFFGTYSQESTSSGSGIIIGKNDTELLIVTNYHVVANSKELSVVFSPVEKMMEAEAEDIGSNTVEVDSDLIPKATVKGYDADRDVAVIAVKLSEIPESVASQIKIATIGDSGSIKAGDQVVAIGNSLGYGQSVTTGIVSAVNRNVTMKNAEGTATVTNSFIQTDAAINPGNSGGALVNAYGHLIGINTAKISSDTLEGLGFAIPIDEAKPIISDLIDSGYVTGRPIIGIGGRAVTEEDAEAYNLKVGVYVSSMTPDSPAYLAGVKIGDIIVECAGKKVTTVEEINEIKNKLQPGDEMEIKVYRQGKYKTITLVLGEEIPSDE